MELLEGSPGMPSRGQGAGLLHDRVANGSILPTLEGDRPAIDHARRAGKESRERHLVGGLQAVSPVKARMRGWLKVSVDLGGGCSPK